MKNWISDPLPYEQMVEVQEGQPAPDFELAAYPGERFVRLGQLRGRWVVLYFYPRDMTSGCTREAEQFRDLAGRFQAENAVVLGVSTDSLERHRKFAEKLGLNFPLLSDPQAQVARLYGVWKEKKMYGRTFMGIERTTFLIDPAGIVRRIWRKVRVAGHATEVLKEIQRCKG